MGRYIEDSETRGAEGIKKEEEKIGTVCNHRKTVDGFNMAH